MRRVTGSRASRGKRPTCGTSLLLHKQVPPAQATRRIHLAPSAPKAVLPLLALPCLFPLTLPVAGQLRVLSPVYRYLRPGRLEVPPSWDQAHVVARSTVPNAPLATPRDVDLPADDASEASDASAATANSRL